MTQGKNIEVITLEQLFSENTTGVLPILADIQHPNIKWKDNSNEQENGHLRLINDTTRVRYNGEVYMPAHFEFAVPQEDGKKIGNSNITISAIDQRIVEIIRSINDIPPTLVIEAFFCNMNRYKEVTSYQNGKDHYAKDEYGEYRKVAVDGDNFTAIKTRYSSIYVKQEYYSFSKINHYEFQMQKANWDNVTARWELIYDPASQVNVPVDVATSMRCPGVNLNP